MASGTKLPGDNLIFLTSTISWKMVFYKFNPTGIGFQHSIMKPCMEKGFCAINSKWCLLVHLYHLIIHRQFLKPILLSPKLMFIKLLEVSKEVLSSGFIHDRIYHLSMTPDFFVCILKYADKIVHCGLYGHEKAIAIEKMNSHFYCTIVLQMICNDSD